MYLPPEIQEALRGAGSAGAHAPRYIVELGDSPSLVRLREARN